MVRPTTPGALARARPAVSPLVAVALAVVIAGCGSSVVVPPGSPTGQAGSQSAAPSTTPGDSSSAPSAEPSDAPVVSSDPGAASAPPTASGSVPGYATECSGSPANRSFFADVAALVGWAVYCGVVPDGWFVESGNYRLRDGGQLTIAYRGPGGTRLELREGSFCADASCTPSGQAAGTASFGDREGAFIEMEGGGYAVVVGAGSSVSWLAVGANLDEATFRDLAAALRLVAP